MSGYPPAPPAGAYHDRPAEPGPVRGAFALMLVRCVISVLGLIITIAKRDEIKRKILEKTPTASASTVDGSLTIGLVIGAVILVFYLALAFQVRAGRNWARIVTWVFAALGVISLITSLSQPTIGFSRVIAVVSGLIDVAIIVLLALAPSNVWFRRR